MAVKPVNCAGYISNNDDLFPFGMIVKRDARPGNIAIISQSGKICLNMMQVDYMNFSYLISAGNCSCLLVEDYIDYLIDDPGTKVIGLYLEGVKDPEKFTAVLRRAAVIKKPIVILKVGRSSAGSRVASSHTGSLPAPTRRSTRCAKSSASCAWTTSRSSCRPATRSACWLPAGDTHNQRHVPFRRRHPYAPLGHARGGHAPGRDHGL